MSITTKGGDKGKTSLYSGERIWKDDLRVDAYGSLDELDANLGEAKHLVDNPAIYDILISVQNTLYRVMGQLATISSEYPYPLCESDAEGITGIIHDYETRVQLTGFVIPGSTLPSAKLDICRTVARRAERRVIALSRTETVSPYLLSYVNRLSDLFFILARSVEHEKGKLTYKTKPEHGC
ncbi:MAG: cob(I)yrinic acid a,c-diamide adenosyltransferase [Candidatus Cloacimonetes bacterium]|nr:cob(I)yrinic acid a,c-diamide adenosyltransferase [Candidatus Cloacimonadota bacterium]